MKKLNAEQEKILTSYVKLAKKLGAHPTIADVDKAGVTRNKVRHHFRTYDDMRKMAKKFDPKAFENIIDEELFTPKNFRSVVTEAGKYCRFVVTTAVMGCEAHEGFLASLRNYCKINNALLLIIPCKDPAAIVTYGGLLDPALKDEKLVIDDFGLNKKIFISAVKLGAKHMDPATSLTRIGQRNGSFIYASPKQRLKMTPTSNKKLPHAVMTTGAVTRANYKSNRYLSDRTAYIAEHDHVLGAVVVEVMNEKRYHFRQVQADRRGHFIDLGVMYMPKSVQPMPPELIVLGDFHSGETDESAFARFVKDKDSVTAVTGARRCVLHDGFNGMSISHHEIKNRVLRAQRAAQCKLSLADELAQYAKDLNTLTEIYDEVIIAMSNHDEFLIRYLMDGTFIDEPHNSALGARLFQSAIDGHNPVKTGVEMYGLKRLDRIRWLDRDEDFKVAGVECGAHGDKGANGSRGSLRAMENAYGNSISGHSHTPEILRNAWQVGTLSKLKLVYAVGPSSWMHTSCLLYPNGAKQLINVIDGHWRVSDSAVSKAGKDDKDV